MTSSSFAEFVNLVQSVRDSTLAEVERQFKNNEDINEIKNELAELKFS